MPRLAALDTRVQFVMSDLFELICDNHSLHPCPLPGSGLDEDMYWWNYTMQSIVSQAMRLNASIEYDIFNEPNSESEGKL